MCSVVALGSSEDLPPEELAYRLRQQTLLSEFGMCAIRCETVEELLAQAVELCARGMGARLAKILRFLPNENRLLVVAGVGWRPGVVGHATLGADLESPAGYAVATGEPVISNHLGSDHRFRTPALLADYGVKRAINVVIRSEERGHPYGVLEVDSTDAGCFDAADLIFMQGFANLLGVAIERQRKAAALVESEEQMRLIIEGATDYAIFTIASDGTITSWCPGATAIFGWDEAEILECSSAALFTPEDRAAGVPTQELAVARHNGCAADERWHIRKDGSLFWASGSTRQLHDATGAERGFVKIVRDATKRRAVEQRLHEEAERQRLLNAEISHRVKNSLALVAGLLGMQARGSSSDAVRDALREAENRVTTIARVHDQLWRSGDAKTVELSTFLRDLCDALQDGAPDHRITCDAAAITLATDRAVPLALIVNELVTNALKYAYPSGTGGEIWVQLRTPSTEQLCLEVSDKGAGLPGGFDAAGSQASLGMRVVASLVRQLGGKLWTSPAGTPGARFTIEAPI